MLPKIYLILNYKEVKYWVRFSTVTQQGPYQNLETICNLKEAWSD